MLQAIVIFKQMALALAVCLVRNLSDRVTHIKQRLPLGIVLDQLRLVDLQPQPLLALEKGK